MTPRNLRLIIPPLFRFAEANAKVVLPGNGNQSNVLALLKQNLIKKSMLWLVPLFIFTSLALKAQSPQKINFQSIVRNTSGVIVSNKSVRFKVTILTNSITGIPVYSETHLNKTDAIGLVSLEIGTGTLLGGVFSSIDWGNAAHFIKLEADFTGGTTYELLGAQELMSVPYALYAVKTDTSVLNLMGRFSGKVNVTDTSSMLAPYLRIVDANGRVETDPVFNSSIAQGITGTDTAYWNKKLNTADTSAMLANYRTALNAKAPLASPTFTGTVSGIDKAMVGLGSVDNTTDLNKPVSTLTQTALNLKVNVSDTSNMLNPYLRKADAIISNAIAIIADLQNQVTVLQNRIDVNNLFTRVYAVDIDGNNYQGVSIGGQIWMSENLKTSRYNNGDLIPIVTDNAAWSALTTGGRSWYVNDSTTYENPYGNLYNWHAVADSRGLCPTGWHVPTDAEWTTLTTYLGGESVAGSKMKTIGTTYWNSPNTGATNESGFSALPGGYRFSDGSFGNIRNNAFFWSANEYNNNYAWFRTLYSSNGNVYRDLNSKSLGASVRCLRD